MGRESVGSLFAGVDAVRMANVVGGVRTLPEAAQNVIRWCGSGLCPAEGGHVSG